LSRRRGTRDIEGRWSDAQWIRFQNGKPQKRGGHTRQTSTEDPIAVADSYSANATFTLTRQVNVTSPTAANIAAVFASFLADLRKRGIHKST
jgi:predicted nucleic acid-binding Zn ribbon protein